MGNLSCVSCQTRKTSDTKNKPVPPPPTLLSSAAARDAETVAANDGAVIRIQELKQQQQWDQTQAVCPPATPSSLINASTVVGTQELLPLDDRKLLDWWWETVCQSHDLRPDNREVPSNDDRKTPSIEEIANAIVQLTLYLASQVVCPAIERHLAETRQSDLEIETSSNHQPS